MLRAAFEMYGEVTDAFVTFKSRTATASRVGYVTFKDEMAATKAV